jgi:GDP-4-dehydro-6-deoxy-D-mannose reductase
VRAFITGASGFVGGWLTRHLKEMGDEVIALPDEVDLAQPKVAQQYLIDAEPDVVYHLAALTHVGRSWENPTETFRVNVLGTIELFEVVRELRVVPRVVLISSSEVYGAGDGSVLDERAPFRPVTPYAASKVAAEITGLQAYLGRNIEVVRARPFNHIGPGQAALFVVSALARRIAEAELSGKYEITVGNLDAARDFTDVRDVVRAYRQLAIHGLAGEVYNVCSGEARTISELFHELVALSSVAIEPVVDPGLFRPVDVPLLVGSAVKLHRLCAWTPTIATNTTLRDVLQYWRSELGASA